MKPTSTALGSAWAILAPSSPYWVRWASSTMMMTLSEAFRTSSDPPGVSRASSNFWMVVMRVRPPPRWRAVCRSRGSGWSGFRARRRWRRCSGAGLDRSIRSGAGKPQRWKVLAIWSSSWVRSVTVTMVELQPAAGADGPWSPATAWSGTCPTPGCARSRRPVRRASPPRGCGTKRPAPPGTAGSGGSS